MIAPTQTARLVAFLRSFPGASSLEITQTLRIVNVTGRVSDARARGVQIDCIRRSDGFRGYVVRDGTLGL